MRTTVFAAFFLVYSAAALPAGDISATLAKLDEQFVAAWNDEGIQPAAGVDDARYLRRIYLDIAGTLPTPERVREFLLDPSGDKRSRAVDQLLDSPEYAVRWANYWNALLMGRTLESANIDQNGFKMWLRDEFAKNAKWDEIVTTLITAEGWNTNRKPNNVDTSPSDLQERYAPAVNWFLKYWMSMPELSSATSKIFLGVQLQCAQCHDHKTEKWTQNDYKQFTAFFVKTWPTYFDKGGVIGTTRVEVNEHAFVPPITAKNEQYLASYKDYVKSTPKLLDGHEAGTFGSRRKELAKWITAKDNPYFTKAFVNRMWGLFLGRGFVEPIDDFRPSNPATLPEALETLAADFSAHDYDIRHLIRVVCASKPYNQACQAVDEARKTEPDLWSRYPMKQLEVEVLLEEVLQATGSKEHLAKLSNQGLELIRLSFARQFVTQISNDDSSETTNFDETIPRALMMLNGPLFCGTTRTIDGLAEQTLQTKLSDDRDRIDQLYLMTLSRLPTDKEAERWLKFVATENAVVTTAAPADNDMKVSGLAAAMPSMRIVTAPPGTDFSELIKNAKSGADFKVLYTKMRNNADAALYIRALREFSAEAPFRALAQEGGGKTAKEQAYEDLHWALLNCSEFLTNH
ncbi:MAG TPA: DUF1549 domain-containing protein [Pirellulaceae bacterium]|jgi:hypothetical protein